MRKGVLCILLSAFGFALMAMFVRLADGCGGVPLPAAQKAFFRNAVAVLIAGWAFARRPAHVRMKGRLPANAREWTDLLLRAAFGTGAS